MSRLFRSMLIIHKIFVKRLSLASTSISNRAMFIGNNFIIKFIISNSPKLKIIQSSVLIIISHQIKFSKNDRTYSPLNIASKLSLIFLSIQLSRYHFPRRHLCCHWWSHQILASVKTEKKKRHICFCGLILLEKCHSVRSIFVVTL